jgi:hypothetical protein
MLIPIEKPVLPVPLTTMENPVTAVNFNYVFTQPVAVD